MFDPPPMIVSRVAGVTGQKIDFSQLYGFWTDFHFLERFSFFLDTFSFSTVVIMICYDIVCGFGEAAIRWRPSLED